MVFLLCAFKGSLQTLLDDLFATLDNGLLRTVSKKRRFPSPAKTQSPTAFEALNYNLVGLLNELLPEPRWQGLRLVATDSITLCLPPWLENQAEFAFRPISPVNSMFWRTPWGLFPCASKLMLKTAIGRFDGTSSGCCWCPCCRSMGVTIF